MHGIFYSYELAKEIEIITKKSIGDILEEDLLKIKRLSLNKRDFSGKDKDYCIVDLIKFENLEVITFSNFTFSKDELIILSSLPKVKFIHFDFCNFNLNKIEFSSNVEEAVLNCCDNFKIENIDLKFLKILKIIGLTSNKMLIDIEKLNENKYLKDLSINNFKINNVENVLKVVPNLVNFNLDGSEILDEDVLKSLKLNISHKENFRRVDF